MYVRGIISDKNEVHAFLSSRYWCVENFVWIEVSEFERHREMQRNQKIGDKTLNRHIQVFLERFHKILFDLWAIFFFFQIFLNVPFFIEQRVFLAEVPFLFFLIIFFIFFSNRTKSTVKFLLFIVALARVYTVIPTAVLLILRSHWK